MHRVIGSRAPNAYPSLSLPFELSALQGMNCSDIEVGGFASHIGGLSIRGPFRDTRRFTDPSEVYPSVGKTELLQLIGILLVLEYSSE